MEREGSPVLILGCGYTGRRVARRLIAAGRRVLATSRSGQLDIPGVEARTLDLPGPIDFSGIPDGVLVLHSIPVSDGAEYTAGLLDALGSRPGRLVYLSTTGVYGRTRDVDERTVPAPRTERERLRCAAERLVLESGFPALVLRPAAIYGPGRGIQVSMAAGTFRLAGTGGNYVSRIHVEDLAELACRALSSNLTGAYPVADDHPCTSLEIARYCSGLLGVPLPAEAEPGSLHETRRSDRRVDGRAIRRLLGVELRYPGYREGIPAALDAIPQE